MPAAETAQTALEMYLTPIGANRFLDEFYTQRCCRFQLDSALDLDAFLSMDAIEAQLSIPGAFETMSVAMRAPGSETPGFVRSLPEVYEALSKGQGLQIARYDRLLPVSHPLARIFQAFGSLCHAPGHGMTVFVSPPGAVLPPHNDPFEIFALQVQGSKTWRIYDFASPQAGTDVSTQGVEPAEVHELKRGDVFYAPKGIAHDVLPGDGTSVSVALIYRPASWQAIIEIVAEKLSTDRRFWQSLPVCEISEGIEARRAFLHEAIDAIEPAALARLIEARRLSAANDVPAGGLATALAVDGIGLDTPLLVRDGPCPMLISERDEVLLHSAHDTPIRVPAVGRDAVQFMLTCGRAFTPEETSDVLSANSKLALVRKLARRGLLRLAAAR